MLSLRKKKSSRTSKLTSANDVVENLLYQSNEKLSHQFICWQVKNEWLNIVGTTISEHTQPETYQQGTLYVWVDSAAWMNELVYMVKPIRDKINQYLGQKWVSCLRFSLVRHTYTETDLADQSK